MLIGTPVVQRGTAVLSPFQREKLEYYFKFFDVDGDGYLMKKDLTLLFQKIIEYTGWEERSAAAVELYEVHSTFFEVLHEKTDINSELIGVDAWMSLWEHMIPGCMGMHNFPIWLRLLPRSLFRVMDTKEDGHLDALEIREFYESFVKIPADEAGGLANRAFNEMTDHGRYPLTLEGYEQIFANFLLGRTKYGPGRYIFGCFEHSADDQSSLISGPPKEDAVTAVATKFPRRSSDAIRTPLRTV
ncbi:sarcoplasmic calcium-binding proteins II, V, VI, and VII-like isoform X2 [Ylistrum balloti]|uniref:sarcoplasmic calcium-binding proteins II, V, VI, and VII-like isoform X2 n=1 Tax=Ylistrum balloti TaxID=509963 RepID=UPI002905EFFD|nr:sarcoplasmic calcium-binding proteins II, V, VI, and VII-like isoform X2 [Ylistrum balloti]